MKVSVYDLEETLFEGEADKVIARTTAGEVTILKDHIPLITVLDAAPLRLVSADGKETRIHVRSGVLEVRPDDRVVVLVSDIY